MAALAGDLSKAIKGQSEAAQAFRPWWDTLEDNLLYGFVILGESGVLLGAIHKPRATWSLLLNKAY